jgi:hypothetical protein
MWYDDFQSIELIMKKNGDLDQALRRCADKHIYGRHN